MKSNYFLREEAGDLGEQGGGGEPTGGTMGQQGDAAQGGGNPFQWPDNWKDQLPDEIKGEKSLNQINDIPSLAKSYVHAQKMVGANKAVVPDPKVATDEDWRAFFQKAGLPESVDNYELEVDKEVKENLPEGFLETFKQKAYENNVLPQQAKALFDWYRDYESGLVENQMEQQQQQLKENLEDYRKMMGAKYEKKIGYANKVLEEMGNEDLSELLQGTGLNVHPQVIEFMSSVGEKLFGEDEVLGEGRDTSNMLSPQEAREKIDNIKGDKNHPYWNRQHPNHDKAVNEMTKLFELLG